MAFNKNKLYYFAILLQMMLVSFFYFTKECVSCGHEYYIGRIEDYKTCAHKMDSVFKEQRDKHNTEKIDEIGIDSDKAKHKAETDNDKEYNVYDKTVSFIDTVKVSYVGKDGVSVVTNYPFHKVIVD